MKDFIEIIKEREIGKYIENVSLKKFTSYKVGGIARCVVYPKNVKKLIELLRLCKNKNVKYVVDDSNLYLHGTGNTTDYAQEKSFIQNYLNQVTKWKISTSIR